MFTASSQHIKLSMTGGRLEAGISSQIPDKYKQRNMRWTDLGPFFLEREMISGERSAIHFSAFH